MKTVLIKWLDSKSGSNEWEYIEELESLEPIICESLGFLLEDNEKYKTLASTKSGSQVWGRITIPTCSIVNFQILSE